MTPPSEEQCNHAGKILIFVDKNDAALALTCQGCDEQFVKATVYRSLLISSRKNEEVFNDTVHRLEQAKAEIERLRKALNGIIAIGQEPNLGTSGQIFMMANRAKEALEER